MVHLAYLFITFYMLAMLYKMFSGSAAVKGKVGDMSPVNSSHKKFNKSVQEDAAPKGIIIKLDIV